MNPSATSESGLIEHLRRLVADRGEVLLGDLGLEHVVDEQVGEHRVLAAAQQHHQVVVDQTLAVRGEPVAQDVDADVPSGR